MGKNDVDEFPYKNFCSFIKFLNSFDNFMYFSLSYLFERKYLKVSLTRNVVDLTEIFSV